MTAVITLNTLYAMSCTTKLCKLLIRDLAEMINMIHCNSQREALMSGLPVKMSPIGWKI